MGKIRERFEQYWHGEINPEEQPPFQPMMVSEEVQDQVLFVSSLANVTAINTGEGLVLFDVGSFLFSSQIYVSLRQWSKSPVHSVLYTHGHVDHVFGVERFDKEAQENHQKKPTVVAHSLLPARFDRYKKTAGYNACINSRQFKTNVEWPTNYRYPDITFHDRMTLDVGGERIEIFHAKGETDDAAWAWVPSRKLLCTGDLIIWACPNAGNPQKVQRFPLDWARALRTMSALDAELLCPGHGVPIFGKERVKKVLLESAQILEYLHDETLLRMNQGMKLNDILHEVKAPAHLLSRPYLRPLYDEPEFIVRNVWRLYGGWWSGDPSELQPPPSAHLAAELASLAGGAKRLIERAQTLASRGDLALACHLAEMAWLAAPGDLGIQKERATIYKLRGEQATSLMAKGVYFGAENE